MCVYIVARNHLTRSLPRGRASRDPVLLSALSLAIRYHNERRAPLHFFTVILCCNLSLSLSLFVFFRPRNGHGRNTRRIFIVYPLLSPSAFFVIFAAHCFDFTRIQSPPHRFDFHNCRDNNRDPSIPFSGRRERLFCFAARETYRYCTLLIRPRRDPDTIPRHCSSLKQRERDFHL